jgi:uracil-DNA glycosylase|tara:strand:+ start:5083 stop:5769 length:687 start_codon:yes stop_codon:yes gene_type:complete
MERKYSFNLINNLLENQLLDNNIYDKITDHRKFNIENYELEVFPEDDKIFKCFEYFNLLDTKVVILGQDPYHGKNQATGLAFGIDNSCPKQPSLKNIEKELLSDLNIKLTDQTLEKWAKQNILLLNSSLTVVQNKPGSDVSIWSDFTNKLIEYINNYCNDVIFVAWGAFAHNKLKNINTTKHNLIISSHPSPLSCFKNYKEYPPFNGSKPFSKINNILINKNQTIINW